MGKKEKKDGGVEGAASGIWTLNESGPRYRSFFFHRSVAHGESINSARVLRLQIMQIRSLLGRKVQLMVLLWSKSKHFLVVCWHA
jgi:hypothetical protein